jgi:FKBP-type peptidyl-prolyl cis-trans isomerase FklB
MIKGLVIAMGICFLVSSGWAGEQVPLSGRKAKESYSLGYEFGKNLTKQEIEIDADIILRAVSEALAGKDPALSQEEIKSTLQLLRQRLTALRDRRALELADKTREEGKAFLASNKMKEGVITLPSGLQYKVLREGNGPRPAPDGMVKVNYRGTLIDGTEFDSSYRLDEPPTIAVSGVIKAWTEALPLMKTGSKWQLVVPPELAYGERRHGRIPANTVLIFELEVLSIPDRLMPAKPLPGTGSEK